MKFDQNGKRINEKIQRNKKFNSDDDVFVDLESRYAGISDSAISIVFEMVRKDKIEEIHAVLRKMESYYKINTFI